MGARVLLNLSNSLQKSDKMLGKPRILSLFATSFINSGARMLDYSYF